MPVVLMEMTNISGIWQSINFTVLASVLHLLVKHLNQVLRRAVLLKHHLPRAALPRRKVLQNNKKYNIFKYIISEKYPPYSADIFSSSKIYPRQKNVGDKINTY